MDHWRSSTILHGREWLQFTKIPYHHLFYAWHYAFCTWLQCVAAQPAKLYPHRWEHERCILLVHQENTSRICRAEVVFGQQMELHSQSWTSSQMASGTMNSCRCVHLKWIQKKITQFPVHQGAAKWIKPHNFIKNWPSSRFLHGSRGRNLTK